jgi:transcriptional regulator with XRE-family HTH domain
MQAETYIFSEGVYTWAMSKGRPASQRRPALGEKIATARIQAGLTQSQLAEKLGVSQRVVTYWEREAVGLKAEQLASLTKVLNVPAEFFIGGPQANRGGGPSGKARLLFEQVSKIPRSQQRRILETVEDMLLARQARNS